MPVNFFSRESFFSDIRLDIMKISDESSTECALGITEFLNPNNEGCGGVIKERFSDFNVYEIDKEKNVVKLGDQNFPEELEKKRDLEYSELKENQMSVFSEELFERVQ